VAPSALVELSPELCVRAAPLNREHRHRAASACRRWVRAWSSLSSEPFGGSHTATAARPIQLKPPMCTIRTSPAMASMQPFPPTAMGHHCLCIQCTASSRRATTNTLSWPSKGVWCATTTARILFVFHLSVVFHLQLVWCERCFFFFFFFWGGGDAPLIQESFTKPMYAHGNPGRHA
jgi:hypothetical protein